MFKRILVAVDLSPASLDALREAHARATANGGALAVCHVLPQLYSMSALFPQDNQEGMLGIADLESQVRGAVDEAVRAVVGTDAVEIFVEQGVDYAEIIRCAETWSADLVVVGSQGHTSLADLMLGGVAERVVHYAHSPVLVVRPARNTACVLVATDLSDPSLPALAAGVAEASRLRARLVVANVLDLSQSAWGAALTTPFGATSVLAPVEIQREMRDALTATLQQALEQLGANGEAVVLEGSPATAIVRHAEEISASLLVIGTHGRTGLARIALGSVADQLLRTAECSVLAVRLARKSS